MKQSIGLVQMETDTVVEITPIVVSAPIVQEVRGSLASLRYPSVQRTALAQCSRDRDP
jgi:hypothetical protein